MDILFSGVSIVTMDEAMHVYVNAYLGVTGTKISYIGKEAPAEKPEKIIEGSGMVLMPGFVNANCRLNHSLLRGTCEDASMAQWLEHGIFPMMEKMDKRTAKTAVLLSLAECLRFGITSVSELDAFSAVSAEAVAEVGMKGNFALPLSLFTNEYEEFDFDSDPGCTEMREMVEKWHNFDNGRIKIGVGLEAEYTSNYRLWEPLVTYAAEQGLGMSLHLSECPDEEESCLNRTGLTAAQLLDCHNVFSVPTTAIGCDALTPEDQALLGKRKVSAVSCPVSNLKFGRDTAPIVDLAKAGINVALGTDSPAANNNLDMFEEMKTAALWEKQRVHDASALPATAPLLMATVCGAKAQGRSAECGMLKVGMDADLILVDFTAPHLMPCHDILSSLVYSARGSDVALTMVRGKILYSAGTFHTIDLKALVQEMADYAIPNLFTVQD